MTTENILQKTMCELISAMSSLNMEPETKKDLPIRNDNDTPLFLSEVDKWAEHSMKHMEKTASLLRELENFISTIKTRATRAICSPDKYDSKTELKAIFYSIIKQ